MYPTCSYVAFMPSKDLSEHIATLEKFINGVGEGDYSAKRQNLFDALWDWGKRFSGNPELPKQEVEKMSLNQLIGLIQGVKGEGLFLVDPNQNILLGNITTEAKMSNEKFDAFINTIIEKTDHLKKAYRKGKNYEFVFSNGDEVYFWIPMEDLF